MNRAFALLPFLLACSEGDGQPTAPAAAPAAAASAGSGPPPAPAPTPKGGDLPDLRGSLAKGLCADGPGAEGADSYFLGEFTIDGSAVTGTESWVLFANPKWAAKGGKDCTLVWRVSGTTGAPKRCGNCDLSVTFHAEPQLDGDCPEELILGRKLPDGRRVGGEGVAFDQTYDIQRKPDGSATVFFAKSGKPLGEGYHAGGKLNYLSQHQCKWF
jgi:hypothetical protein